MDDRAHESADPINPQLLFHELSKQLPDRAILTSDSGSSANWYARDVKLRKGMMGSLSGTLATMGPGVPYAIGAKFAHPDRPVFALVGDGAMQMNGLAELITVAKYWREWSDPRFFVMVLNNRDLNQVTWELRAMAGEPQGADHPGHPRRALRPVGRADRPQGHPRRLTLTRSPERGPQALAADRPVLVEAITDPSVPPLPPHITIEQAQSFMYSLLRGDPERQAR